MLNLWAMQNHTVSKHLLTTFSIASGLLSFQLDVVISGRNGTLGLTASAVKGIIGFIGFN